MASDGGGVSLVERLRAFGASTPLTRVERFTLFILVAAGASLTLAYVFAAEPEARLSSLFQFAFTCLFALFAWSPATAVTGFLLAMAVSFAIDEVRATLVAVAIATGCVVRTAAGPLVAAFSGGFLLSGAAAALVARPGVSLRGLAAALLIAAVSGAIGLVLSLSRDQDRRLRERLRAQERAERDAALSERQRIADELHDVIAHDLTVIAMHSRVLEQPIDPLTRQQSHRAIGDAARKALGDLRRVVEQTGETPVAAEPAPYSLAEVVAAAQTELLSSGRPCHVRGDPEDIRIPRLVSTALARILRESVTNILKHAATGSVGVTLRVGRETVTMTVSSALAPQIRTADLPSGGYGLMRLSARARQLGGELRAGAEGGRWVVSASIPIE